MSDDIIDEQIAKLRAGSRAHWKREIEERGVRGAWPDLVAETGDPVRALRHQAQALRGAYLGRVVDPDTGEPTDSAVLPSNLSKLIVGPPNVGKTTRAIIPGALQDLARGARVLLVTPQPKTFADIQGSARAVGDSGSISILDFGGQIVEHQSKRLTTWDPTTRCENPEAAREFARALTGERSPVAADLGQGRGAGYWLQIPEGVTAAAAHLTAIERAMKVENALRRGLSPERAQAASLHPRGLSGIGRVFDYLRRPAPPDPARAETRFKELSGELRSALTPRQREALRDQPARMREMEAIVEDAAYHASRFPLPLQKLAYNRALLELQGAPIDRDIAGTEVEELAAIIQNIAKRDSDPLDQLGRAVRQAIPPSEQRILSPRPRDIEISPQQIVEGPGGLYVVSYDSAGSPGLAAGWFCEEVLKAGFRESKALAAERLLGGTDEFTGISAWIDEGGALKHMNFDLALKEGRQHNIAVNVSATSIEQMTDEIGAERANTITRSAPITVTFAPTPVQAAEVSDSFGKTKEQDVTYHYQSDNAGYNINVAEREIPRVSSDRVRNLKLGEVVLTHTSGSERRDNIVQTSAFHEQGHPVGDTMAFVDGQEGPDPAWDELLPEARRRLDEKLRAKALRAPAQPGALRRIDEAVESGPRPVPVDFTPVDEPERPADLRRASEEPPPPPPDLRREPTDF